MTKKIVRFQQLQAWQEAHKLVLEVYRATQRYPAEEKFGLVSQMRRAAISVPANIAEGFKRRGQKDKIRFYNIAEASLEELKYFLILSGDLGYLKNHSDFMDQAESVSRLLYRLIMSIERGRRGTVDGER